MQSAMFGALDAPSRQGATTLASLLAPLYRAMKVSTNDLPAGMSASRTGLLLAAADSTVQRWQLAGAVADKPAMAFCGEIFNKGELLGLLELAHENVADADLMTRAFLTWGEAQALQTLRGKFALAFWNPQERVLVLASDRTTEINLYYGRIGTTWLFGTDFCLFKPFHSSVKINRQALSLLVRYGFVPAPHTFYREVRKLSPGHYVLISDSLPLHAAVAECRYAPSLFQSQPAPRIKAVATTEAVNMFEALLLRAVQARMRSGPVGAFMSSGFDSTLMAALVQKTVGQSISTFTAGFHGMHVDEAPAARAIAKHLGTQHHEVYVDDAALAAVVYDIPKTYSEPLADSSQLPSMLLARAAGRRVDTVFTGDGGDCVLGEYVKRHEICRVLWRTAHLSPALKRQLVQLLTYLDKCSPWLGREIAGILARFLDIHDPGRDALEDVSGVLRAASVADVEQTMNARVLHADRLVIDPDAADIGWHDLEDSGRVSALLDQLVQFDGDVMLPPVINKTAAACNRHGLRAAMPFLDADVLGFAGGLPHHLKYQKTTSKWLLRQVAYRYIPRVLLDRPKIGFSVWVSPLLRCQLRDWAEHLLAAKRLESEGFFHVAQVRREWTRHLHHGENFREERLWSILMFQQWLESSLSA